jgi:hypothetical protein
MKKLLITSMLIASAIFLFTACESNQSADQLLKNDTQRSDIIGQFINHQPYRMEMMDAMLQNDSCRNVMGQRMAGRPEMMGMMMSDPIKMNGTMDHMVAMAASDSTTFNAMIKMMKGRPEMWNKVMQMNTSKTK